MIKSMKSINDAGSAANEAKRLFYDYVNAHTQHRQQRNSYFAGLCRLHGGSPKV